MTMVAIYSVFCEMCGNWAGQDRTKQEARKRAQGAGFLMYPRTFNARTGRYGIDLCSEGCKVRFNTEVSEGNRI